MGKERIELLSETDGGKIVKTKKGHAVSKKGKDEYDEWLYGDTY